MADWTDIPNSEIAIQAPITSQTMVRVRDNIIASTWHPWDGGNDPVIYDFGVNGSVITVTTSNFLDGYDYRMEVRGFMVSSGGVTFQAVVNYEDASTYTADLTDLFNPTQVINADIEMIMPRASVVDNGVANLSSLAVNETSSDNFARGFFPSGGDVIQSLTVRFSGNAIIAGTVRLYRRRNNSEG